VYTFSGGTDRLVKAMKSELERNGGALANRVQVDTIVVEAGRVVGIEAHGRFIAADAVVSNASLKSTALGLA
jgi:phytoene dehydrogenase-like protein